MTHLYEEDLAFIQAQSFGGLAAAAVATVIPRLQARGARRVVDVGCGAGVSTKALVDAGFDTVGIEPSEALLALARQAAPAARFQKASAYDVELEECDAVFALGEALTYHAPTDDAEERLRRFFGQAGRALSKGGLLVCDLIEVEGPGLDARAWRAGADWAVLSATNEDVESRRLVREIETFRDVGGGAYRRRSEAHHVRLFERGAVVSWLRQAGFEVELATRYGTVELPPRRVAFYASR